MDSKKIMIMILKKQEQELDQLRFRSTPPDRIRLRVPIPSEKSRISGIIPSEKDIPMDS